MTVVILQEQHFDMPAGTLLYVHRVSTNGAELVTSLDSEGVHLRVVPAEKVGAPE